MIYRFVFFAAAPIYLFGFLWFCLRGDYLLSDVRVQNHIYASVLFFTGFVIGGGLIEVFFFKNVKIYSKSKLILTDEHAIKVNKVANISGYLSCIFILLYVIDNGMAKILAIGSNLDGFEFRTIGWNHDNKFIQMPMELSRRAIMPFVILTKLTLARFHEGMERRSLFIFIALFGIATVINLDRGPLFVFIVMFAFYFWVHSKGILGKLWIALIGISTMAILGWAFTLLQYNSLDKFQLQNFLDSLFGVMVNRLILSPVIMGQTWVFDFGHEPLYLQYSRISVLWGGAYVGHAEAFSQYVAPVGIIGDIERNFGTGYMTFFGLFLGLLFKSIQKLVTSLPEETKISLNFVALVLSLYLVHGGIFSLGPVALILFILLGAIILKSLFKSHYVVLPKK